MPSGLGALVLAAEFRLSRLAFTGNEIVLPYSPVPMFAAVMAVPGFLLEIDPVTTVPGKMLQGLNNFGK